MAFLATGGDIKEVLRTMAESPEFNSTKYFHNKVKTPMEFLASAYRATLTDPSNPGALVNTMRTMGMPLYNALPPTGYLHHGGQQVDEHGRAGGPVELRGAG